MAGGMSSMGKQELLATIRDRYQESSGKDKRRILEEFITVTGHHRKHGIRLLAQSEDGKWEGPVPPGDGGSMMRGVREAVILVWEVSRAAAKRTTVVSKFSESVLTNWPA